MPWMQKSAGFYLRIFFLFLSPNSRFPTFPQRQSLLLILGLRQRLCACTCTCTGCVSNMLKYLQICVYILPQMMKGYTHSLQLLYTFLFCNICWQSFHICLFHCLIFCDCIVFHEWNEKFIYLYSLFDNCVVCTYVY